MLQTVIESMSRLDQRKHLINVFPDRSGAEFRLVVLVLMVIHNHIYTYLLAI